MQNRPVKGALFITMAGLMFAVMGTFIKKLSVNLDNQMIVFARNLCVLTVFSLWFIKRKNRIILKTDFIHLHFIRSLSGLTAMYLYFYTLSQMHLAEAVMLSYTSPFFIPFAAFIWLKEPVYKKFVIASFAGFIGILLILKPGTQVFNPAGIYGIMAAVSASIAMVSIRRMSDNEPPLRIVFYYTLIATFISFFPAVFSWQTPGTEDLILIILMGFAGFAGQFFVTTGYSMAPSAQVGPFTYTTIFFAAIIGVVFLNEKFDMFTASGGIIIICAGIIALRTKKA
jgi:drug/metabolite transporter (DMT)-like permease